MHKFHVSNTESVTCGKVALDKDDTEILARGTPPWETASSVLCRSIWLKYCDREVITCDTVF